MLGVYILSVVAYIGRLIADDRQLRRQTELAPVMLRELRKVNGSERLRIVLPGVIEVDRRHDTTHMPELGRDKFDGENRNSDSDTGGQ